MNFTTALEPQVQSELPEHLHRRAIRPGPLSERYRPRSLEELAGQPQVQRFLRRLARAPYPAALLLEGETGTGKTSAALALAAELGCKAEHGEAGGVHVLASGEQNAEAVRQTYERMWQVPLFGSGWKVVIVNEADRMSDAAETIWLDRLESLPPRTLVIFTTNYPQKLPARFRDRCIRLSFEADAQRLRRSAAALALSIWKTERGEAPADLVLDRLLEQAEDGGKLSFRRLLQAIEVELMAGDDAEEDLT